MGLPQLLLSNAKSVKDFKGLEIFGGASSELGGADISYSPDGSIWTFIGGFSFGPDVSPPALPFEAHGGAAYTPWIWSREW